MDYRELLDAVRRHVKRLKVDCAVTSGKPASEKAVAAAEAKLNVRLPAELREFYRTVADGYAMFWQADANDSEQPFGEPGLAATWCLRSGCHNCGDAKTVFLAGSVAAATLCSSTS